MSLHEPNPRELDDAAPAPLGAAPDAAPRPSTAPVPPPVRGLRLMSVVRWILFALVTAVAGSTVWTFWGPDASRHAAHAPDRFHCPMHPQIRSPRPGHCPICHMDLEPIPAERQTAPQPATDPHAHPGAHDAHARGPSGAAPPDVGALSLPEDKQRQIDLATSLASRASLGDRLRVPGVVSAPETGRSEVRVRAPGFVERVAVRQTGVRVARGEPLAWIYSPEVYRAQSEFLTAMRWKDESTPTSNAGELAIAARRALELLGLAASDIDEIVRTGRPIRAVPVRAPSAGYVTRYAALLGTRADPDMVLYEIADLSKVWVIANVAERDIASIERRAPARFTPVGADPIASRIELIEPSLDEATRTARLRIVLPNRDGKLRPGQFGQVELELPAAEGIFVPRDAVIRTGEHEYVFVAMEQDRFEPRTVRTGRARDDRVEIREGLTEGERVVTRGGFMLDSESRLQASLAGRR